MNVWHSGKIESHDGSQALHFYGEENFVVHNPVLPHILPDLTKFHLMEYFKLADISSVEYPGLTDIQESQDYNSAVDYELGGLS